MSETYTSASTSKDNVELPPFNRTQGYCD
jgi:hypothetical protein